jgi:hypothetical protein
MIPNREEILTKINEAKELSQDINNYISGWLNEIECPDTDKQKILDDLASY